MKKIKRAFLVAAIATSALVSTSLSAQWYGLPCDINIQPPFVSDPVECNAYGECVADGSGGGVWVKHYCPTGLNWHCIELCCDWPWETEKCCPW
ncbi:chitin binding peritrophin-A domain-containing protein [Chitinophaga sp. Hz27]|uniref:chitin binding peritrophin-A domain-containing protein n=1 Tax=Chitinophaga sp. Hz27 TaxID=3347169 RepID=UPI0035DCD8AA